MGGFLGEKCRPFCNFFGNPAMITVLLSVFGPPEKRNFSPGSGCEETTFGGTVLTGQPYLTFIRPLSCRIPPTNPRS